MIRDSVFSDSPLLSGDLDRFSDLRNRISDARDSDLLIRETSCWFVQFISCDLPCALVELTPRGTQHITSKQLAGG